MNKTINQYINQLHLDPRREAAVRKLVESVEESPQVDKLVEALTIKFRYKFVDLGLPSGIKWATYNVGATKPEEYGLYFAWGETEGYTAEDVAASKKAFTWDDYKFGTEDNLTKYNDTDRLTVLELEDDASYQSDKGCRIPSKDELQELIDNTTQTYETLNGVKGKRFTSKTNGNSVFVPAAGFGDDGSFSFVGSNGYLWSSSINESNPSDCWALGFGSSFANVVFNDRCSGFSVRAVQDPNAPFEPNAPSEPKLFNPADYVTKTELDETIKEVTSKNFVSTVLASDASNEDIINKINELINGLISIGIIKNEL